MTDVEDNQYLNLLQGIYLALFDSIVSEGN